MAPLRSSIAKETFTPFLYPWLYSQSQSSRKVISIFERLTKCSQRRTTARLQTHAGLPDNTPSNIAPLSPRQAHLNPSPASYSITPFTDRCTVNIFAGSGGHGCVSFLREKYTADGPANGGDGGSGGNIYIQAVRGETSLHKLARRSIIKAERGKNGQGKSQGGERGEDVVFTVPVGTVVREVWRHDPVAEEKRKQRRWEREGADEEEMNSWRRDKWISYPGGMSTTELANLEFPKATKNRDFALKALKPSAPIRLDLDEPMEMPMLLAAGAVGGLGNPHFVTKDITRPKYATKGEGGIKIMLELELKLLADVGLVGLPNAGKSTLLRALSNSRTRIGNWAFTTLQPSVGTVVLDNHKGRPTFRSFGKTGEPRTHFTIADIPGLIEDAHLDKGLGLGFLRHVERAAMLVFVVDLSAGDAVSALEALWREVGEYETLRNREISAETETRMANERLEGFPEPLPKLVPPISSKPWFVAATKADLAGTEANFAKLQAYINLLNEGKLDHPSGRQNAWKKGAVAVPLSAIKAEGVEQIPRLVVEHLE